jgi:hypothetical protein
MCVLKYVSECKSSRGTLYPSEAGRVQMHCRGGPFVQDHLVSPSARSGLISSTQPSECTLDDLTGTWARRGASYRVSLPPLASVKSLRRKSEKARGKKPEPATACEKTCAKSVLIQTTSKAAVVISSSSNLNQKESRAFTASKGCTSKRPLNLGGLCRSRCLSPC